MASLAAAAAAHSYHHRNRSNPQEGPNFGPTLNATGANFAHNMPERDAAPMTHLRNINPGSGRYPQGYRQNVQQGAYALQPR